MYGDHEVVIETGKIARQSTAAVMVTIADTTVLVSVVGRKNRKPGQDFFPLTVNYEEKTYAAGKIPGGFFKREGRPSEREALTARLIDRPIRPLFPKGFMNVCVSVDNNLVADTNDSKKWDTLQFPLPKGKWSIKKYLGKCIVGLANCRFGVPIGVVLF